MVKKGEKYRFVEALSMLALNNFEAFVCSLPMTQVDDSFEKESSSSGTSESG